MDDIEDITLSLDDTARVSNKKHVLSRKLRSTTSDEPNLTQSNIPGLETIYMKTWGCSHNSSDGEYMAGQLASFGYTITDNPEAARLWVLNSCTVKSPSEDGFVNAVKSAKTMGKEVVLAGCVPQAQKNHRALKGLSVVGVQQIDRIVDVVEETLKGNTVRLFGSKRKDGRRVGGADLALPKIRRNPLIEIIAINTGCLNHCTYCKTKQARGDLASYLPESIVARAEQSFEEGVCEIWLTSEDTGAYGRDIGSSIPELLWQLVEVIPDGAMLRLGMTNPPYILDHLEEMAKLLAHPRVYSFLHIPVQSASDSVLANMKREYTAAEFRRVVDFLKEKVPGITIATDVICGFPGETEEDFEETVQLVRDYQFPSLFINQFYPRPGTPAARMKRLPTEEVKRRTREISKVFQSYHPYDHKLGEIQEVLVTEEARDKKNYVAHNKFYEQVLVPQDNSLLGKRIRVKITETGKHYLVGKILNESATRTALSKPLQKGAVSGLAYQIRNNSTNDKNNPSLSIGLLLTAFLLGLVSIYFVI